MRNARAGENLGVDLQPVVGELLMCQVLPPFDKVYQADAVFAQGGRAVRHRRGEEQCKRGEYIYSSKVYMRKGTRITRMTADGAGQMSVSRPSSNSEFP